MPAILSIGGCTPAAEQDADTGDAPAQGGETAQQGGGTQEPAPSSSPDNAGGRSAERTRGPRPDTPEEAEMRAEIERLRRGYSGPTNPEYHPEYADEPGQSFADHEAAARALEERLRAQQEARK